MRSFYSAQAASVGSTYFGMIPQIAVTVLPRREEIRKYTTPASFILPFEGRYPKRGDVTEICSGHDAVVSSFSRFF